MTTPILASVMHAMPRIHQPSLPSPSRMLSAVLTIFLTWPEVINQLLVRERETEKPVCPSIHPRCGLAGVRSDAIAWDEETVAEQESRNEMAVLMIKYKVCCGLPELLQINLLSRAQK